MKEADALADKLTPKLSGLTKGMTTPLNAASKALDKVNVSLGSVETSGAKASAAIAGVGSASTAAAGDVKAAGDAAAATGRQLGSAANKSDAMASALNGVAAAGNAASPALTATGAAAKESGAALGTGATGARQFGGSLREIVNVGLALRGAHMVIRGLADAMNDAREYGEKTALSLQKIRDETRELKAIMGENVTSSQAVSAVADLMLVSGGTESEVTAFKTMFESALPAARKMKDDAGKPMWELSDKDTKEVEKQAARFAIANQIDPATVGRMVPSIGTFGKVKGVDDVMGQLGMIHQMGVEAVGRFTPVMKDYNVLAGALVNPKGGGGVKSPAELVGLISAVTVTSGSEAKAIAQISAAWKELSFANNEAKKETFLKLGIVPGKDDYVSSIEKMKPLLVEGRKAGRSDADILDKAGFKLSAARMAIVKQVGTADVLREQATTAATKIDPKRVERITDKFKEENPERFAAASSTVANWDRGQQMDSLVTLRKYAEAGLNRNRELNTPGSNVMETLISGLRLGGLAGQAGRESHLDDEVRARIRAAIPNADKKYPGLVKERGLGHRYEAEGEDLADIIRSFSAEEKKALTREMETFGITGKRGNVAPVGRAKAANAPPPAKPPGVAMTDADRMLEGPSFPGMGLRSLLAASAMGAVPGGRPFGPGNRRPAGLVAEAFGPETEREARRVARRAANPPKPSTALEALAQQNEERGLPTFAGTEKQAAKVLAFRERAAGRKARAKSKREWSRRPSANAAGLGAYSEFEGADSYPGEAIATRPPVQASGDWMNWGKSPETPLDPYAEMEGADTYPGYSPRGGKIGSMKVVDTRTNAERAGPIRPRGEGWMSSFDARAGVPVGRPGAGLAGTSKPRGPSGASADPTLVKVNQAQLKVLERMERKMNGASAAPPARSAIGPLPVDGGDFSGRRS